MKITTQKNFYIETSHYRLKTMSNGIPYSLYKITGTEEEPIVVAIKLCGDELEYDKDCVANAFADDTEEVHEQRWAESLVKLQVEIGNKLKEYSI